MGSRVRVPSAPPRREEEQQRKLRFPAALFSYILPSPILNTTPPYPRNTTTNTIRYDLHNQRPQPEPPREKTTRNIRLPLIWIIPWGAPQGISRHWNRIFPVKPWGGNNRQATQTRLRDAWMFRNRDEPGGPLSKTQLTLPTTSRE